MREKKLYHYLMYPYLFNVIPSYTVMLAAGVLAATGLFRCLCGAAHIPAPVYRVYAVAAIVSIAVGIGSAFLFQAIYDFAETGKFAFDNLTFMGGLAGGALTFIIIGLCARGDVRRALLPVCELAAPCIVLAHAIGRMGCFMAGCCYGRESRYGLVFPDVGRVIPTQLYESIFLFALFGVLLLFTLRGVRSPRVKATDGINLAVYCLSYSVFRFTLEFFRGDPRGAFAGALSPSQLLSIIMFAAGITLAVLRAARPALWFRLPPSPSESE